MAAERRGVALIFVVVTLAVLLILATVVLANTASERHRDRVRAATLGLSRFKSELGGQGQQPSFIGDLSAAPGKLSHLYVKLSNAFGDLDSCNGQYSNNEINNWRGPYHLTPMVRDQPYQIEPGLVAEDTLMRTPPTASGQQPGTLSIVMLNVQLQLAQDIGLAIDGVTTGAGPQITFIPSGSNPVTMYYNIPIQGC